MFNQSNGYSLADIAAATGGNRATDDMFGGNGAWWIIVLFLFAFAGAWGNGNGFLGGGGSTGSGITDGYILTSDFANIERKIDGVNNGLCDGFYAMNTGMLNGFANTNAAITTATTGITSQLTNMAYQNQQCCCDLKNQIGTEFAQLNYNLADQSCQTRRTITDATRDIIDNQNAGVRSILDFLTQDKIATLQAENQSLKFAASQQAQNTYLINALNPAPVPAYTVPSPYTAYHACGCGCTA